MLHAPLRLADSKLHHVLKQFAQRTLDELPKTQTWTDRVRTLVAEELAGVPSLTPPSPQRVIFPVAQPLYRQGHLVVLKGNLAPGGAVAKISGVKNPDKPEKRPPPSEMPGELTVMREYNEALVRKLEERNAKLEKARTEILRANEDLERRVQERTAELADTLARLQQAANQVVAAALDASIAKIGGKRLAELVPDET